MLFFSDCIDEWNKLNPELRKGKSIDKFKKSIKIKKPENSLHKAHDPFGVEITIRLKTAV